MNLRSVLGHQSVRASAEQTESGAVATTGSALHQSADGGCRSMSVRSLDRLLAVASTRLRICRSESMSAHYPRL
jgi:hypothetical protein